MYVLLSSGGDRTYVGITTDPERRLTQHNGEAPGGAKSTRGGRPWRLAKVHGPFADRSAATKAERALKRLRGAARLSWSADPSGPAPQT